MTRPLHLFAASRTETGRRPANDDCVLVDPENGVYVVCDGARGRFGGHTAAELAVASINTASPILSANLAQEALQPGDEQHVETMLLDAHRSVVAAQAQNPALEGTTSTVAMVVHRGSSVLVSHIGDTRVYLMSRGRLQLLTTDHNLENYVKQNPGFRPKVKVSGKTLVRALGLKTSSLKADHKLVRLEKEDLLLISTDGLSDSVPHPTLARILQTVGLRTLEEVSLSLIRAALNHGSADNISLILLQATDKLDDSPRTFVYELSTSGQVGTVLPSLAWLVFLEPPGRGRLVPLEASTVLGADPGCRVVVAEDYVSSRHAEVLRTEHGYQLRDLGSTNGTYINNVRAHEEFLVDGDIIRVGRTELVFKTHRLIDPSSPQR